MKLIEGLGSLDTFLSRSAYLQMLTPDTKQEMAQLLSHRIIRKGKLVSTTTEISPHVLLFLSGSAKANTITSDGREVFHGLIGPGQIQGVISAMDELPSMHQIQAITSIDALAIEAKEFRTLAQRRPDLQQGVTAFLVERVRYYETYKTRATIFSAYEKVAQSIADLASGWYKVADNRPKDLMIYVTQRELSLMLGLSRQSVNKSLKHLEQQELIQIGYSSITIRDYLGLRGTVE